VPSVAVALVFVFVFPKKATIVTKPAAPAPAPEDITVTTKKTIQLKPLAAALEPEAPVVIIKKKKSIQLKPLAAALEPEPVAAKKVAAPKPAAAPKVVVVAPAKPVAAAPVLAATVAATAASNPHAMTLMNPPKNAQGDPSKAAKAAAEAAGVPKTAAAKRGRKPKPNPDADPADDADLSDIEADLEGEAETEVETEAENTPSAEKVKPLRMKISKAKERALMKEFGLDETVLSEEDLAKRRSRLKTLIKLGKTRGYLTHAEISDHLPDKLIDAETLEVVIAMLNDMGVAVYEQTPDAETLLLTNTAQTAATEEEAEEAAEAALSTVDSEFGRTTDPVRMYMREMGTVELLTREGEIEIAKRIEGGLQAMMEAISASPATIAEI
jgi:RNA polymerase primary sigma factor